MTAYPVSVPHLVAWRGGFRVLDKRDVCRFCDGTGHLRCYLCKPRDPCDGDCVGGFYECDECDGGFDRRRQLAVILGLSIDVRVLDLALAVVPRTRLVVNVRAVGRELRIGRMFVPRYTADGNDRIVEVRHYAHQQLVLKLTA